ncbi:hypothetical protein [Spirosoma telluris]
MLLLIILAQKIKVAYPVLLVVAGLAISFVPGVPMLNMDPELIFIIFLPSLLYKATYSLTFTLLYQQYSKAKRRATVWNRGTPFCF